MNKTHEVLENMTKYSSKDMFAENFLQNLIRFEYLINERYTRTSFEFTDFLDTMPDYIVDISKSPEFILRLYENCQIINGEKFYIVEPFNDEDTCVIFKFGQFGRLLNITLRSENKVVTLGSNQDVVVFETKEKGIKLVNLFKDYFSLNIKRRGEQHWDSITSIEKERLDNKIMYSKMLLGI